MQKGEKTNVALVIPSVGVCVCLAINAIIFPWLIYHLAVEEVTDCRNLSSTEKSVLTGFTETVSHDYEGLQVFLETWPYACVLVAFCFLANILHLPNKMLLLDTFSVLLVCCIHGWEFTIIIIVISIAFSLVGAYIGKSPLFVLFVGLIALGYVQKCVRFCLSQSSLLRMYAVRIALPDLYASVVRAIILGIEHARMRSVTLTGILRNSIGYTFMSPVCMSTSFVLFQDWMKWRDGTTKEARGINWRCHGMLKMMMLLFARSDSLGHLKTRCCFRDMYLCIYEADTAPHIEHFLSKLVQEDIEAKSFFNQANPSKTQFHFIVTNHHHLDEERPSSQEGETVRRTVSIPQILLIVLRLGFWTLVLKYGLGSIDFIGQLCGPVRRITQAPNVRQLDGFIAYFIAFLNVGKFSLFHVVFYGYGRAITDLQQFLLSPLFEGDASRLVVRQRKSQLLKSIQDCSLGEKFIYSEVTMNCLMPDGPSCLLGTLKSSEIWRTFDRGIYSVMKHYIYFPIRNSLLSIIPPTSVVFKELGAASSAAFAFIFVLSFHTWNRQNCVWVCSSFLLWSFERFGAQYYNSMKAEEKITSLLSAEWACRIRCLGYATVQLLNILGFMFYLSNYDAGCWLAKAVLTNWLVLLECWTFLYTVLRVSVHLRTWLSPAVKEDHKDKL